MAHVNTSNEIVCPFTGQSIENAYGAEIALVLHCHLRGYDRQGEGEHPDLEYYDKYGAPPKKENSWEEGYHVIERRLADHYNAVDEHKLPFPLVAGMGGGVHLYKSLHDEDKEPWNWTGWIPLQRRWLSEGTFFSNRHFLGLRGNEIQNNLWDYDPHDEEAEGADPDEMVYSQVEPNDRYRGGYWYYCQPFGRYLHIISLKSHEKDPKTCLRYNYIVHPLAYRAAIDTLPDNSVDAMQWCIINIPDERHFGTGKPWGEKCHGLEIFNDFTYFYSYQTIEEDGPNNSELGYDPENPIDRDQYYYYWFDTYPMEFAVFLLDSALARGVYLHTLCANDAFYEKTEQCKEGPDEILLVDPKAHLFKYNMKHRNASKDQRLGVKKAPLEAQPIPTIEEQKLAKSLEKIKFLERPYGRNTSFGFVTLLDPEETIKKAVFEEKHGIPNMGLNIGETMAMKYLNDGYYYATTGLHKLFQCDCGASKIPFRITRQSDSGDKLCYNLTTDMALIFTFLKCTERNADLIWRYTIMVNNEDGKKLETSHGYFMLDKDEKTKLDLSKSYDISRVKWLYFTAISPNNSQRRAWFHAIKGPAFGEPRYSAKIQELSHNVVRTTRTGDTVTATENIEPTRVHLSSNSKSRELDFALGTGFNNKDMYVYFMQVCPRQQDFSEPVSEKINNSSDFIPPRILQSVHGYFSCREDHPTRLNLNASWDKDTVKDNVVYFYRIDAHTGAPYALGSEECKPELFIKKRLHSTTDSQPGNNVEIPFKLTRDNEVEILKNDNHPPHKELSVHQPQQDRLDLLNNDHYEENNADDEAQHAASLIIKKGIEIAKLLSRTVNGKVDGDNSDTPAQQLPTDENTGEEKREHDKDDSQLPGPNLPRLDQGTVNGKIDGDNSDTPDQQLPTNENTGGGKREHDKDDSQLPGPNLPPLDQGQENMKKGLDSTDSQPADVEMAFELTLDNVLEFKRRIDNRLRMGELTQEQHRELLNKLKQSMDEPQKPKRRRRCKL